MLVWGALLIIFGGVSLLIAVYALVTRSAGIYQTTRQFWTVLLVSAAVSYLLSGALVWFVHISPAAAVILSAIVPFLVGNVFSKDDSYGVEDAPADESEEQADDDAEDEAAPEEMIVLVEDHSPGFERFSDLLN